MLQKMNESVREAVHCMSESGRRSDQRWMNYVYLSWIKFLLYYRMGQFLLVQCSYSTPTQPITIVAYRFIRKPTFAVANSTTHTDTATQPAMNTLHGTINIPTDFSEGTRLHASKSTLPDWVLSYRETCKQNPPNYQHRSCWVRKA